MYRHRPRQQYEGPYADKYATDIGMSLGMCEKRADYILEKWERKGWWDSGVTVRTGWLTPQGLEAALKEGA
jgi:hypothetical protein